MFTVQGIVAAAAPRFARSTTCWWWSSVVLAGVGTTSNEKSAKLFFLALKSAFRRRGTTGTDEPRDENREPEVRWRRTTVIDERWRGKAEALQCTGNSRTHLTLHIVYSAAAAT